MRVFLNTSLTRIFCIHPIKHTIDRSIHTQHHFEEIVASKARGRAAKKAAVEAAAAENGATKGGAGGEGEEVEGKQEINAQ